MLSGNAVAGALVAADGVIDKLELATNKLGSDERAFLAVYQTKLASAATSADEDLRFLAIFMTWFAKASRER